MRSSTRMLLQWRPLPLLLLLLLQQQLIRSMVDAQQVYNDPLGYRCVPQVSGCQAYASYRPLNGDRLRDVASRFGISVEQLTTASNISSSSDQVISSSQQQNQQQLLLVPLNCSCTATGRYQYNTTYIIQNGDTMYIVSNSTFEGLTTYQAVEASNPSKEPTKLEPGDVIIFPIRCACPQPATGSSSKVKSLVTYSVLPNETIASIAAAWGVSAADVAAENSNADELQAFTTLLLPMAVNPPPLPKLQVVPVNTPPQPSPSSPPGGSSSSISSGAIAGIVVGASAGVLLAAAAVFVFCRRRRTGSVVVEEKNSKNGLPSSESQALFGSSKSLEEANAFKQQQQLMTSMAGLMDSEKPTVFTFEELQEATNNFSNSNLVEGSVHRGSLRNTTVAIKEMKGGTTPQELKILAKVHHSNLVRLVGVCSGRDYFYLVYEFAEKGSLSSCLHSKQQQEHKRAESTVSISSTSSSGFLSWNTRLQIAMDVAIGLEYIHDYTKPSFVHKDIKSSNILLDASFRAKIANFGMARLIESTADSSSLPPAFTKHIAGTQGYMAPEYLTHGFVTSKVDVYAFGVVLVELLSGREAIFLDDNGQQQFLSRAFAEVMDDEGQDRMEALRRWVDPNLENVVPWVTLDHLATLARSCLSDNPDDRPDMKDITYALSKMLEESAGWEAEFARYNAARMEGR